MRTRVAVLGPDFGGLELTTILSDAFGGAIDIGLIDKNDAFVFGFSKLEAMFGRQVAAEVRHPYRDIVKPGVRFLQSTVAEKARFGSSRLQRWFGRLPAARA